MRSFLKKFPWAVAGLVILIVITLGAIFADFLSPYPAGFEDRAEGDHPPSRVHILCFKGKEILSIRIYSTHLEMDPFYQKRFVEDKRAPFKIEFFSRGYRYRWLGVFESDLHLFTVTPPGRIYLLGADSRGRDIYSRILQGSRISLAIGFLGALIAVAIGLMVGALSGLIGGWIDTLLMRVSELFMMIPGFYLLLALRASLPANIDSQKIVLLVVVVLGLISWAQTARIVRGHVLNLKQSSFVDAARLLGRSEFFILIRHLLPHTFSYGLVVFTLSVPSFILTESSLSFLGLGIQDPFVSLGLLMNESLSIGQLSFHPWILWPMAFLVFATLALNLVGDALRDYLEPKERVLEKP